MPVVGDASIVVRAITTQVRNDIRRGLEGARSDVQNAGRQAGVDYSNAFQQTIGNRIGKAVSDVFDDSGVTDAAGSTGRDAGRAFTSEVEGQLGLFDGQDAGRQMGESVSEGLVEEVTRGAEAAGSEAERSLGGSGRRGGNSFKSALNSAFADSAVSASRQFTVLIATGNLLGTAIATLVSSISAAISGLFAMGAAASQAAGALAVLPGAIGVAVQAFGALRLAMSGVGEAVKAGLNPAPVAAANTGAAVRAAAEAIRSAIAAVEDAQQSLSRAQEDAAIRAADARNALVRAYRDAAEAASDSAIKVADAESRVLDTERELLNVQKDLNRARREAAEDLQQLGFDAEDAALAEERAGLRLQDAFQKLVEAQKLPPDSRARKEAELSFKEAELNLRQAKDRSSDLAEEQQKAAKAGVEGSDEVLRVRERIADAEKNVIDAEKKLADARADQARQQRDSQEAIAKAQENVAKVTLQNSRSIADAQEAVREAQERVARAQERASQATETGTKAADKYQTALAKLSPAARDFVKFLVAQKSAFGDLRAQAGELLFPRLQSAIEPIIQRVFPVLGSQLRVTGGLMGTVAQQISGVVTSTEGLKLLSTVMKSNNDILKVFTTEGANGSSAIENLTVVFLRLSTVIQPITQRFAEWIAKLTGTAEAATDSKKEMDGLRGFLERAGDTAAQLGRIFGNLVEIVGGLGKAATPAGQSLLDSFEKATQKLSEFIALPSTQKDLTQFFKDAAENLKAIGSLISVIGFEFLKLGDNKGVKGFADGMKPAVENFGELGDKLTNAGPQLAAFVTQVSELFLNLTQSGALQAFIGNLTAVLKVVNSIVSSDSGQKILGIAGAIAAITRVAALALIPARFLFKALLGGPIAVIRGFSRLTTSIGSIPRAFRALRGGAGLTGAFRAMTAGSKGAEKALIEQMAVDKKKVVSLKALELQADRTALALRGVQAGGAPVKGAAKGATAAGAAATAGAVSPIGAAGSAASKGATDAAKSAGKLSGSLGKVGNVFKLAGRSVLGFLGPIGLLMIAIPLAIAIFKKLFRESEGFRNFVNAIVAGFKTAVDWIVTNVFPVFVRIGQVIADVFVNKVIPILKVFWTAIKFYFKLIVAEWTILFNVIKFVVTNILIPIINNVVIPVFKGLWIAVSAVFTAIKVVVESVFNGIAFAINTILIPIFNNVLIPAFTLLKVTGELVFDALVVAWNVLATIFETVWQTILAPLIAGIVLTFQGLGKAASAVFTAIGTAWNWVKDRLIDIWNKFVSPLLERAKLGFQRLGEKFGDVTKGIRDAWSWVKDRFIEIYNKFIKPAIDRVKNGFGEIATKVDGVVKGIKGFFENLGTGLGIIYDKFIAPAIKKVKDGIEAIRTTASNVVTGIGTIFNTLKDAPAKGIQALIGAINQHLIGNINKLGDVFKFHIPDIPVPTFAAGGEVRGPGGPTADRILARLSNKEFVVNARDAQRNMPILKAMNAGRSIAPMAGLWNPFKTVKNVTGDVAGFLTDGLGIALERIIRPFSNKFVPQDNYVGKFWHAILDKLIEQVKHWGDDKEKSFMPEAPMINVKGTGGGGSSYGGVKPWVAAVGHLIQRVFGVRDVGGVGGRPNASDHPTGHALDFMVYKNKALGDRIAAYLLQFHERFFITYLIWFDRIISGKNGWKWRHYTHPNGPTSNPTLRHMDHVHASFRHGVTSSSRSQGGAPLLARGGVVRATPGGVLSIIGEAGRHERVEPLDSRGLSQRDKVMLELITQALSQSVGGGEVINVHPSKGMNEIELAEFTSRRLAFKRRTGT